MRLHLKLWFDLLRQPPTRPIAPGSKLIPRPSKIFAAAATKRFLLLEERTFLEVVDATTGSWLHTGKTARAQISLAARFVVQRRHIVLGDQTPYSGVDLSSRRNVACPGPPLAHLRNTFSARRS